MPTPFNNPLSFGQRHGRLLLTWLALCASCSHSAQTKKPDDAKADVRDGGTRSPDDAGKSEPIYAINIRVFGENVYTPTSYLKLVSGLETGDANLNDAIEIPGGGSLWGMPESGVAYFVSAEELTVTKYTLNAVGQLSEAGRLGLLGEGISALVTEAMAFESTHRGFLFDMGSAQAIEFDLDKMEIEGAHDIGALIIESAEFTGLADGAFHRRGDEIVAVVYGSNATYDQVAETSKVGFFNLKDASLEVVEAPCGGLLYSVATSNRDIYFASDPWVAGVHAIDDTRAPAPCLVRLPADSKEFDQQVVMLNPLTNGITGGIIPGADGYAYLRVLDESVFPITSDTSYTEPFYVPAWTTWRISLPNPQSAELVERPHIAGGIKFANVGGDTYQNESSADFASTTLVRTTGKNAPTAGLHVPGVPWNIVKIR